MFRCLCRLQTTGGQQVKAVRLRRIPLPRTCLAEKRRNLRAGTGYEAGGGVNYFIKGSREQRGVLEVLYYDDNPADNSLTPYRAFYSGTAIQVEFYVGF